MDEIQVILVDNDDNPIGLAGKTVAHEKGLLHRAVSVFIVNEKGEWLLQQRSLNKYHSAGLWTNTTCTHPLSGESNLAAASRRLKEEMGIECQLQEIFSFTYFAELENGLIEHEFDHVFLGISNQIPTIDTTEIENFRYVGYNQLKEEIENDPFRFTIWFKLIFEKVNQSIGQ